MDNSVKQGGGAGAADVMLDENMQDEEQADDLSLEPPSEIGDDPGVDSHQDLHHLDTFSADSGISEDGAHNQEDLGPVLPTCGNAGIEEIVFTDVGLSSGLNDAEYNGINQHTLGVIWIDVNRDDWSDLFVVNGIFGPPNLFINQGNGRFDPRPDLLPADLPLVEMSGANYADYDNDGDADIFITNLNPIFELHLPNLQDGEPDWLFRNMWVENGEQMMEGQPLFEEVAIEAGVAGIVDPPFGELLGHRSITSTWLDYDRDGWLDLYVGHWVLGNAGTVASRDRLYRNLGDGTFEDVTTVSGLSGEDETDLFGSTLGVVSGHLDDDLWPDLYVIQAHDADPYGLDRYYGNNGDGTFTRWFEMYPEIGDDAGSGMGADIADIDLNGTWDIYISDIPTMRHDATPYGVLYLGNGDGTFQDNIAEEAGVPGEGTAWGVNFFDVVHNGWEDLFVSASQFNYLYFNNGDQTFTELLGISIGLDLNEFGNEWSRGSAISDYDRDGDLDIAIVHDKDSQVPGGGQFTIYRNDTPNLGCWLQLSLRGLESNLDAIGALVEVDADGVTRRRQVKGGVSAHAQDDPIVHVGLGQTQGVDAVRVYWPSGSVTELESVPVNSILVVEEQDGIGQFETLEVFPNGFDTSMQVTGVEPIAATHNGTMTIRGENLEFVILVSIGSVMQNILSVSSTEIVVQISDETPLGEQTLFLNNGSEDGVFGDPIDVTHMMISEVDISTAEDDSQYSFLEISLGVRKALNLSGYVVAVIDGQNEEVFRLIDLGRDGVLTNDDGLLVVGGDLPGVDLVESTEGPLLPFGENAVALYQGSVEDFAGSLSSLSDAQLRDAVIYETGPSENHPSIWSLMSCCSGGDQEPVVNELFEGDDTHYSIQRCPGHTALQHSYSWGLGLPTSGAENACSILQNFAGDCMFDFEYICPIEFSQCGAIAEGEAGCANTGDALCIPDGLMGLELQAGESLTLSFDPPILEASIRLLLRSGDIAEALFYDSEGESISIFEGTLFCLEFGAAVSPTHLVFDSPVYEIQVMSYEGEAFLTDLIVTR